MDVCIDNVMCDKLPTKCGKSIECSSLECENYFIAGKECPYLKWGEVDRVKEIGSTDKPIETSEFPVYKPNCNLATCRYNANGKCENEEKRKECVRVSRKVLCLYVNDNDDFCGKIEKTGQVVHGKFETHHYIDSARTLDVFDAFEKVKDFSGISKMTLSTGEILEVCKAYGSNRLIEV